MSEPMWSAIHLTRGTDEQVRLTVYNEAGAVVNLTSAKIYFAIKTDLDDDDDVAVILINSTSNSSNFDMTSAVSGIVDVNLTPAQTLLLSQAVRYYFAFKVILSNGKVKAPAIGEVLIKEPGIEATS